MATRELLKKNQVLLIIAVNALISAAISLGVGLLLIHPAREAARPSPTASAAATAMVAGPTAAPTSVVHVVQAGDTISALSLKYDVPAQDIIAANNLTDPNVLQVGMELIIPVGGLPQITPTWTPAPTPTNTDIPFEPPSVDMTATALALVAPTTTTAPTPGASTTVTAGQMQIEISQVIAPGNADREAVVIANKGKQVVDMRGWTLSDANGNSYPFAELRLWPGGSVTVNSRIGQNGNPAFNFYWGKLQALWTVGEVATLKDAAGKVVATFTVK